jgi:hypothetical protein
MATFRKKRSRQYRRRNTRRNRRSKKSLVGGVKWFPFPIKWGKKEQSPPLDTSEAARVAAEDKARDEEQAARIAAMNKKKLGPLALALDKIYDEQEQGAYGYRGGRMRKKSKTNGRKPITHKIKNLKKFNI